MPTSPDTTQDVPLAAVLDQLDRHLSALTAEVWHDRYDYSALYTVGGAVGPYIVSPPFAGPCELCIVAATFYDAGDLAVGLSPNPSLPGNVGTLDLASGSLALLTAAGRSTVGLTAQWQPVPPSSSVGVAVNVTNSHSAFVILQFRARVNAAGIHAL